MTIKIRLINICIRHKCTFHLNNGVFFSTSSNNFGKKVVRIRRNTKSIDSSNNITSNNPPKEVINTKNVSIYINNVLPSNNKNNRLKKINKPSRKFAVNFLSENLNDNTIWNNDELLGLTENIPRKGAQNNQLSSVQTNCANSHPEKLLQNSADPENNQINGRFNELNMQMLPKKLHDQLFAICPDKTSLNAEKIIHLRHELKAFGMKVDETVPMRDVDINLPALEGRDLEEHFLNIANAQTKPYSKIVEQLLGSIPPMPEKWILQPGWTRYGVRPEQVNYPLEDGIIFDVEVCMKEGPLPTLATAVTREAWYGWVAKSLVDGSSIPAESRSFTPDMLVPMESTDAELGKKLNDHQKKAKLIVGHNVSYDRARIKEQYWLNSTGTRFLDTMSLHIAVSGMNSYQRSLLLAKKTLCDEDWLSSTSLNNLADVYELYCNKKHEKALRDIFVNGNIGEVRADFDKLMEYCARDVIVTHEILQKLFPLFRERFPHPVTFGGMLELGTAYLPVNSNWQRYIEESDSTYEDLNYEAKCRLSNRADEVCKLMHNEKYKEDLWMWDADWSTQEIKTKKITKKLANTIAEANKETSNEYLNEQEEPDELAVEFSYLNNTRHLLQAKLPHMPGYPAWYRKLCTKEQDEDWVPGPANISTSMKITPKLLNLTWENYPLHHIKEHGWGFLVPFNDNPDIQSVLPLKQLIEQCPLAAPGCTDHDMSLAMANLQSDVQKELHKMEFWRNKKTKKQNKNEPNNFYKGSGVWCNVIIDNCCWFYKLPHKDGPKLNVGNPLAKDFLNKFSENVLAGRDSSATEVLKIARNVSYWRNNRDRIKGQLVMWLNIDSLPSVVRRVGRNINYGAIIPQVVVSGTLTRRATEATWMTASNAHIERVGSELRAMVQAPPGYNIVGADVDSQELWIASLVGDAYCAGIHGATPFGWMTLIGTKSNGTDMHSVTAQAVGISRDHAKVINYARIYGAGQKFAERLLKQFNPLMTDAEALAKSKKMFAITKGKKIFRPKPEFVNEDCNDGEYTSYDANRIARLHGKTVREMFGSGKWTGGSESAMFNRLEEIAESTHPITPFLNSRLSRALEVVEEQRDKYLPTKINWVVQSGAVDFLHLMLVCMRWLMRDNARFCLSFHDEIRYLVPARHKYNAALAMHVTNLLTRSFCASRLGIRDLPMSVAFFASVEVDTVLRKEASVDCKTPSNPHGLENGYGIPTGESLDVWKALEKSGGSLGNWHAAKIKKKKLEIIKEEENL